MRSAEAEMIMGRLADIEEVIFNLKSEIKGYPNPDTILTLEEVAKELNVKESAVRRLVRNGDLKKCPRLRPMKFRVEEVDFLKGIKAHRYF